MRGYAHPAAPASAPWRPSPSQARLLDACLQPSADGDRRLDEWCRRYSDRPVEADTRSLLPFVFGRLKDPRPDTSAVRQAKAVYLETSWQNLSRIGRLLAVLRRFDHAGIPWVLLKGAALALVYYRNYGMRPMADVDVLVRRADVRRAAGLLVGLGWTANCARPLRLLSTRMRLSHGLPFNAKPLHSLDLHWQPLYASTPEVDEMLWAATQTCDSGSMQVRVLGPTDQVFHVCTHGLQPAWPPSPRWLLDAVTVLDAAGTALDWRRMVDVARRTNTTVRLRAALEELVHYAGGERVPRSVLDALKRADAPRWERHEHALFARTPPFENIDRLRWHWNVFRRLRPSDPLWRQRPMLLGFGDYMRLKLKMRRLDR